MRKTFMLYFLLLSTQTFLWAQTKLTTPAEKNFIKLNTSTEQTSLISFSLSEFYAKEVLTEKGLSLEIYADKTTKLLKQGTPDLPKYAVSLIIPENGEMNIQIKSSKYIEFTNYHLAPSKGNLYRNINPDDVPFVYGSIYEENNFFPGRLAVLDKPYIMRDFRGQCVYIFPFQYNPVSKTLRVYYKMDIEVKPQNQNNPQIITKIRADKPIVNEFEQIYDSHFMNYNQFNNVKYTPLEEQGSMLVISYGAYMNAMQPFVDWKNTIGIQTTMGDVWN